jgi:hypothetical protein
MFLAVISLVEFLISHLSEEEEIVRDIKAAFVKRDEKKNAESK